MKVWGITDIGLVRRENQDSYAILESLPSHYTVCVVCDGMGGPAGGKIASNIAVSIYTQTLEQILTENMTVCELEQASKQAVAQANQAIQDAAQQQLQYAGMGTTLVSAIVSRLGEAVLTNVGDSRAYHISPAGITRVTKDHSWVEHMVDCGDLTEAEARHHPKRNLITRALGTDKNLQCDTFRCDLNPNDCLLLCSDGLVTTVEDAEMLAEIRQDDDEHCLDRLLAAAKRRGAPDNVTAVLLRR